MDQFRMALCGRLIMVSSGAAHGSSSHGPQQSRFGCIIGQVIVRWAVMMARLFGACRVEACELSEDGMRRMRIRQTLPWLPSSTSRCPCESCQVAKSPKSYVSLSRGRPNFDPRRAAFPAGPGGAGPLWRGPARQLPFLSNCVNNKINNFRSFLFLSFFF